jgi:uncharacterized FlaG/YvyC family protein
MIEAVNSVLSNASATRVAVEPSSTARSLAANPEKVQEAARTPYVSPYISIDRNYNKAVLQIRDSETGDVLRQYPTEGQLKAYRAAQQYSERQETRSENAPKTASVGPDNIAFSSGGDVDVPEVTSLETEA